MSDKPVYGQLEPCVESLTSLRSISITELRDERKKFSCARLDKDNKENECRSSPSTVSRMASTLTDEVVSISSQIWIWKITVVGCPTRTGSGSSHAGST